MFRGGFKLFTILGDRCRECPGLALVLQRFPISWGELGNRCKVYPVYTLFRASILDFRPRLANRCKFFPVYTLFRASILDFRARLGNRCRVLPGNGSACNGRSGNDHPRPILIFVVAGENGFACCVR